MSRSTLELRVGLAPLNMFKHPVIFSGQFQGGVSFVDLFCEIYFKTVLSVHYSLVIICWERAALPSWLSCERCFIVIL